MPDKPMLFNSWSVQRIRAGEKSQTRRVVTKRNSEWGGGSWPKDPMSAYGWDKAFADSKGSGDEYLHLPWVARGTVHRVYSRVEPGDRIWVKETWRPAEDDALGVCIEYRADGGKMKPTRWSPNDGWQSEQETEAMDYGGWHPSIFMPKWACRLWLKVLEVRVERVQGITPEDVLAEGGKTHVHPNAPYWGRSLHNWWRERIIGIHGEPVWDANPHGWVPDYAVRGLDWARANGWEG